MPKEKSQRFEMSHAYEKLIIDRTIEHLLKELRASTIQCRDLELQLEDVKRQSEEKLRKLTNESEEQRAALLGDVEQLNYQLNECFEMNDNLQTLWNEQKMKFEMTFNEIQKMEMQLAVLTAENNQLKQTIWTLEDERTFAYESLRYAKQEEEIAKDENEILREELEMVKEKLSKEKADIQSVQQELEVEPDEVVPSAELDSDNYSCSDEIEESDVEEPEARNASPEPDSEDYTVSFCDVTDSDATDDSFEVPDIEGDGSTADGAKEEVKDEASDEVELQEDVEYSVPADPVTKENVQEAAGDDIKPIFNDKFEKFLGQYSLIESTTKNPGVWLKNVKLTRTSEGVEWSERDDAHPDQAFTKLLIDSEFAENRAIRENMMVATFKTSCCFDTELCTFYKAKDRNIMFQRCKTTGEYGAYSMISGQ